MFLKVGLGFRVSGFRDVSLKGGLGFRDMTPNNGGLHGTANEMETGHV